ncbi:TadE/TadG family type IV pilus assembly protein [Paenibacillus sp. MMO-177]|uniref:TadE/TadG family type IV pilus assembly protein n=1 Tax=Paenibacillus sp. MMO-177 TaxID=3081289 RepID=UPI003016817B
MKPFKRLAGLIRRRVKARGSENGSMVLEAALVMPLLLMVLLLFLMMIRLCAVQMALQSAASQTVRQIATHIRPADLTFQKASSSIPDLGSIGLPLPDWGGAMAKDAAGWLPAPADALASAVLEGSWQPVADAAATELGRGAVEPLLRQFADEAVLEKERLSLARLSLPDLKEKRQPYLTIEAEYEFPLSLPFLNRKIVLREQASERVWVSDAAPAKENAAGDATSIQIVSIQPVPLRPGNKATVIALTSPGASASLTVNYKSGTSTAKHLGSATADANGYVRWTWLVSGNTTPGTWELTATSASGDAVSMHFNVTKKEDTRS